MRLRLILPFAVLAVSSSPVCAQCLLCPPSTPPPAGAASDKPVPLRVEIETTLDFSRVAVGAMGGAVDLDPVTGARRLSGDVVDLGGFPLTGVVTVRGAPLARVRVIMPPSVDLESGQGNRARVTGLVTNLSADPRLGLDGRLQFRFGGQLQISGYADGDYRGRIPVTVEYQ